MAKAEFWRDWGRAATNVAMVHEAGHPEPWIIALSEAPTVHRAFDDGLRWGIEPMFSDFKPRGFGIEDSHIQRTAKAPRDTCPRSNAERSVRN